MDSKSNPLSLQTSGLGGVKKELSLKEILNDDDLLAQFREYSKTLQAEENINFWLAVEYFKALWYREEEKEEEGNVEGKRRMSEIVGELTHTDKEEFLITSEFGAAAAPRNSILTTDKLSTLNLSDTEADRVHDAHVIFREFLEEGSRSWCFVNPPDAVAIRTKIKACKVDENLFHKCQKQVYSAMEVNVYHKFLKAIKLNPDAYKGVSNKFTLPKTPRPPPMNNKFSVKDLKMALREEKKQTQEEQQEEQQQQERSLSPPPVIEVTTASGEVVVVSSEVREDYISVELSDGTIVTFLPDGQLQRTPDGLCIKKFLDGSTLQTNKDGKTIQVSADGKYYHSKDPSGLIVEVKDGVKTTTTPDGIIIKEYSDEAMLASTSDVKKEQFMPNGGKIVTRKDGVKIQTDPTMQDVVMYIYPDGSTIQEFLTDGLRMKINVDGTVQQLS